MILHIENNILINIFKDQIDKSHYDIFFKNIYLQIYKADY